jgi:hypothetical protein
MIEVNNIDRILPLLNFNDENVFLVWLVLRNKDGNTQAKGNNKNRTIKSYYFTSREKFEERREEIIKICNTFNCRAYICMNGKPLNRVLHILQNRLVENLYNYVPKNCNLNSVIDHAVMKATNSKEKYWVIDVDTKEEEFINRLKTIIDGSRSSFSKNIVTEIPTAHGVHLITHPFDPRSIEGIDIEIKREGLTLLYANLEEDI